jgi:hypothetical protein
MNSGELRVAVHGAARRAPCTGGMFIYLLSPTLISTVRIKSNSSDSPIPFRGHFVKETLRSVVFVSAILDQIQLIGLFIYLF